MRESKQCRLLGTSNAAFQRVGWAALAIVAISSSGCGSDNPNELPVYHATGRISLKGESPGGAFVALHPKGGTAKQHDGQVVVPRAQVQPDGTFSLTTYRAGDGAPAGEYAVTVEWQKIVTSANGDPAKGPNLVPKQYAKPETSPVSIKIAAGTNDLPTIVLK